MFAKTSEVKVLRDPVHGYVHIDLQVVWDIVNSSWFQRLRRIRQLCGAYVVYHCAEHTRFSHSLGVYEIVRRMVTEVPDIVNALNEYDKVTIMLAGLLHDIGHGPYSHAFEAVSGTSHEVFTCRIIEENTEITKILEASAKGLAKDVADVIRHKSKNPLLVQMISSQLDADRMDYLLRDAYFTGTKYGEFDLERILRTLRVVDGNRLVVKESGVYAVENYIMARYHMYWQIYYHPVARSFETILHLLFKRLRDLKSVSDPSIIPLFKPVLTGKKISLKHYFMLDEYAFSYGFSMLCEHKDPIVRDLSLRIRDRKLFAYSESNPSNNRKLRHQLKKAGYNLVYYWSKDEVYQMPYEPYTDSRGDAVWVKKKDGTIVEMSNASNIVYSLVHGPVHDVFSVYYPKGIEVLK